MWRLALFLWLALCGAALAQQSNTTSIQTQSTNGSVSITTGLTYQSLLPINVAGPGSGPGTRHSLTIQNNNTNTDNCWLLFGSNVTVISGATTTSSTSVVTGNPSLTAGKASILLAPGGSYQRYFPYVPSDGLYVTCVTAGDSVYLDTQ